MWQKEAKQSLFFRALCRRARRQRTAQQLLRPVLVALFQSEITGVSGSLDPRNFGSVAQIKDVPHRLVVPNLFPGHQDCERQIPAVAGQRMVQARALLFVEERSMFMC